MNTRPIAGFLSGEPMNIDWNGGRASPGEPSLRRVAHPTHGVSGAERGSLAEGAEK